MPVRTHIMVFQRNLIVIKMSSDSFRFNEDAGTQLFRSHHLYARLTYVTDCDLSDWNDVAVPAIRTEPLPPRPRSCMFYAESYTRMWLFEFESHKTDLRSSCPCTHSHVNLFNGNFGTSFIFINFMWRWMLNDWNVRSGVTLHIIIWLNTWRRCHHRNCE